MIILSQRLPTFAQIYSGFCFPGLLPRFYYQIAIFSCAYLAARRACGSTHTDFNDFGWIAFKNGLLWSGENLPGIFPNALLLIMVNGYMLLGAFNIVWAAMACLVQKDMKRIIALSSVSHMGFVLLGIVLYFGSGLTRSNFSNGKPWLNLCSVVLSGWHCLRALPYA